MEEEEAGAASSSPPPPPLPPPIAQLGYDQLLSILCLLPPEAVLSFAATCRAFRAWASSDALWEALCCRRASRVLARARAWQRRRAGAVEEGLRRGRQTRLHVRAPCPCEGRRRRMPHAPHRSPPLHLLPPAARHRPPPRLPSALHSLRARNDSWGIPGAASPAAYAGSKASRDDDGRTWRAALEIERARRTRYIASRKV
ncbi:hypothetical protein BAE44_0015613 [Dichanthelium oligosanthes]|uniref:F-box domain-containing protein n=1 Tax=Dichanthelium oligosanthes TaxID=888268 RepID=A0A1E5VDZ4_9POAL|nr:hypothetical protein BAE44_0015613 [Dichanthelium oligosanthes]